MLVLAMMLAACDSTADTADTSSCDGSEPSWSAWGAGFFASYCRTCHSSTTEERFDAPEGVDFDTLDDVRMWEGAIRTTVLVEESMPVGGGVPTAELEALDAFLRCSL